MEQRGEPVRPVAALDDLQELVRLPGPFLSAYLPFAPVNEELAQATALRWRALREEAEALGAPEELLDAVGDAIAEARQDAAAGVGVVAVETRPLHVEQLVVAPPEQVTWQDAPALVPLIAARQTEQPHVVALVDRHGADLAVRGEAAGRDGPASEITVDGSAPFVRKVASGGWSQRRFQQRAEEARHRNMVEVAEDLVPLVERHHPRLLAVGGDERAVGLLVEQLPVAVRELVRPIDVTRATDGSAAHLDDELDRIVGDWVDERLDETLAAYERELGQSDRVAAGVDETRAALRDARVATLLVAAPTGPDESIDRMVADALRSGADVQVVDGDRLPAPVRLAALLRW